jgi:hypothetical protein
VTSITHIVLHPPFTARVEADGLAFDLHEPWYRSLPVSCLTGLDVSVDGVDVPSDRVTIAIDGVTRTVAECADAWQEFWFVQDPAVVRLAGVDAGPSARIRVHLALRIPYIMVGPATALPHHAIQEETFEVSR